MMPVELTFSKLSEDVCITKLSKLVRNRTLPIAIKIKSKFAAKGSPVVLRNNERLLLCFGVTVPMVHGSVSNKLEYRLPVHGLQLYERLPLDPLLDDKIYRGTKSLIEATPLPEMVRVVDAEYSPDPMADQDAGDIIKVRRIEVQDHPERGRERVMVGYDARDEEIRFSEAMDMATYSTMISQDLLPLSELVKYDMPQRARMPEITSNVDVEPKRNKAKEKVVKLHRYYTDYHVIAARARDNELLSIPINTAIDFEIIDATLEDISKVLPSIFNRTNWTWCVTDLTQPRLPASLSAVPQPLEGVFDEWAKSYEGKARINEKYEMSIDSMKRMISNREKEIERLKKKIAYPTAPNAPMLHNRRTSFPESIPTRPPREPPRTPLQPIPASRDQTAPKPKPLPKPRKDGIYDKLPIATSPADAGERKKLEATIQKLKNDIHDKEEEIFQLKSAEGKQKERYEMVCKERDDLKVSQAEDRKQILQLQSMIDHLENIKDGALYEELTDVATSTYSTPYTGNRLNKNMSIRDVSDFMRQIGLAHYVEVFSNEKIDGMMLQHLDEDIMTSDLTMRRIDARRLMTKITQLK